MDRWNKAEIGEIRDTKLVRKSTHSRRVEGNGGDSKTREDAKKKKKKKIYYRAH